MIPWTEVMQDARRDVGTRAVSVTVEISLRLFMKISEESWAKNILPLISVDINLILLTWRLRKALRMEITPLPLVSTDSERAAQHGNIETGLWAKCPVDLAESTGRGERCRLCLHSYYVLLYVKCITLLEPSEMHLQTLPCHAPSPTQSLAQKHLKVNQTPWPESSIELFRPSYSGFSAKLVPTFEDKWCPVVSVPDPQAVFSVTRPEPLLFLSSSSSIVLTKLSGPRSRSTTSQKIW
jgi:hypothetical protein